MTREPYDIKLTQQWVGTLADYERMFVNPAWTDFKESLERTLEHIRTVEWVTAEGPALARLQGEAQSLDRVLKLPVLIMETLKSRDNKITRKEEAPGTLK